MEGMQETSYIQATIRDNSKQRCVHASSARGKHKNGTVAHPNDRLA